MIFLNCFLLVHFNFASQTHSVSLFLVCMYVPYMHAYTHTYAWLSLPIYPLRCVSQKLVPAADACKYECCLLRKENPGNYCVVTCMHF